MNSTVLDKLRSDEHYYGEFGRQYLSNSDIGVLLKNPKMFRVPREDSKALAEGRLFHQLLLEPEKAKQVVHIDVSSRNTNAYKDMCKTLGVDFLMLTNEVQSIAAMAGAMRSNIMFYDAIYADGNVYEQPAVMEHEGLMWKGKADIVGSEYIIDLKTTSDIHKFKYSAKLYNYDSQAYLYQQLFGKPLLFFVVDKETHQLGIFRTTEDFIRGGLTKVRQASKVYTRFFGDNASETPQNHFIDEILT